MPWSPRKHKPRPTERKKDTRPCAARRGYGSKWKKQRLRFLKKNPLCAECRNYSGIRITGSPFVRNVITVKVLQSKRRLLCLLVKLVYIFTKKAGNISARDTPGYYPTRVNIRL
jgi:hypothetical protein